MKKYLKTIITFLIVIFFVSTSYAQETYKDSKNLAKRLQQFAKQHPDIVKLESLTKTPLSNDIWLVTLGKGNIKNHPAVAVVAGIDAKYLVGIETALSFIEKMVSLPDAEKVLLKHTFYVFPNMNPDATDSYFAKLKHENSRTASLYDNDRDGLMSEDGVEDLDGDGMITTMIVESLNGEYIKHPADNRVLIKADPLKGEKGKYDVYTEGIDNDKDGLFNEDGKDGVDLNRNFTYKYKNWGAESGDFPVSEVENRVLADFLFDAFNIHTVISFGGNDNLKKPEVLVMNWRKAKPVPDKNIVKVENPYEVASIENDNLLLKKASDIYNKNVPAATVIMTEDPEDGNFYEWAFRHYGRNSFITPVWSVDQKDERGSREAAYLKWADKNGIKENVVEWKQIDHPDFPEKVVEIGSLVPYAMYAPPIELIQEQIDGTVQTIIDIAMLSPKIELADVKVENLDGNLSRISAKIINSGEMATATAVGIQSYFIKFIRVELFLQKQDIISGLRLQTIPSLAGGATADVSWLVKGSGKIKLEVGCPQAGYVSKEITL